MAGDWIKMRADLEDTPEIIGLTDLLDVDEDKAIGMCYRLWRWADRQCVIDDETLDAHANGVSEKWIDRYVRHEGFAKALVSVGWLRTKKDGFILPNAGRWIGENAKKRAVAAQKKRSQRDNNPEPRPDSKGTQVGTESGQDGGPEKRREEKRGEEKKPPKSPKGDWLDLLTDSLRGSPEFVEAWQTWCKHRRQKKSALTETAATKQIKKLDAMGIERAIAALDHSAGNGWTGLFEPEPNTPTPNDKTILDQVQAKCRKAFQTHDAEFKSPF